MEGAQAASADARGSWFKMHDGLIYKNTELFKTLGSSYNILRQNCVQSGDDIDAVRRNCVANGVCLSITDEERQGRGA